MAKIIQIINSFHNDTLSFRICEVIGTYYNPYIQPISNFIVGSNTRLSWELKDWNAESGKYARIEKNHLRYGRVLIDGDRYEVTKYRIWIK